ncbi:hypothetical protein E1292_11630 [Nonomuraea deserti]|uniref:Uncharacterized protein n=1 Tax=Nonomuraea deserti TaxID=1848322 RepID=A0A4R4VT58_9ACTN|nr:hypothetical protein [Nonomuraea deserti]TDD08441.1 hypothetical protein E1292_11630 [Nonomuraea deserti]
MVRLKDQPSDRPAQAVREVAAGRRIVDPRLAPTAGDVGEMPLSGREVRVPGPAGDGAEPRVRRRRRGVRAPGAPRCRSAAGLTAGCR